jgi:O-antigen ligase
MHAVLHAIVTGAGAVVAIWCAVYSIRWAKRSSRAAQFLASGMILFLGISMPIVNPPQQGVEEAREDKDKKGGESGDPPV